MITRYDLLVNSHRVMYTELVLFIYQLKVHRTSIHRVIAVHLLGTKQAYTRTIAGKLSRAHAVDK